MPRKARAFLVGCGLTAVAGAAVTGWILAVRHRLPEQVVTHWGPGGPDRFTSSSSAWISPLIAVTVCLVAGGIVIAVSPAATSWMNGAAGFTAGMGVFLAAVTGGSIALQAGRAAEDPMPLSGWWLLAAGLGSILIGVLAALAVGPRPPRPDATTVPRVTAHAGIGASTRTWTRRVTVTPAAWLVLLIPLVVFAILGWSLEDWWLITAGAVLTALMAYLLVRWRITVDATGLTCGALAGWPRILLELREIESAEATSDLSATSYGGLGLRVTRHGSALILGGREGLKLNLSDGTYFAVTTPDAGAAAALINRLAAQQRSHPR